MSDAGCGATMCRHSITRMTVLHGHSCGHTSEVALDFADQDWEGTTLRVVSCRDPSRVAPKPSSQSRIAFFCVPVSARRTSARIYRASLRVEKRAEVSGPRLALDSACIHHDASPLLRCNTYIPLRVTIITVQHVISRFLCLRGGMNYKLAIIANFLEPAVNISRLVLDDGGRNSSFGAQKRCTHLRD